MKYKKYLEYKDSGVEWVEEVPKLWNKVKLNWVFKTIGSGTTPDSSNMDFYDGNIPWVNTSELKDCVINKANKNITKSALKKFSTLKLYPKNTLLIALYGATIGKLGILDIEATNNQACCAMSNSSQLDIKYLFYWFLGNREHIISMSYGGGQPNISQDTIKQLRIYAPKYAEQLSISNFLDKKTARIDGLIDKNIRLIELLKEKRQAIINQAVTKGIDKNAKLKPSGIDWIGDISEHWSVKRLQFIADTKNSNVDKKSYEGQEQVSLCNYTDVYYNDFIKNDFDFMQATASVEEIKKFKLNLGDIIITKDSESPIDIAVPAIIDDYIDNLICGYHLTMVKPKQEILGKFLFYCFKSDVLRQQFYTYANGVTRYGLSQQGIKIASFPFVPTIEEQHQIIKHIDEKTSKIDASILKIEQLIEKLKEYKQTLISSAVTGKIDVRDCA